MARFMGPGPHRRMTTFSRGGGRRSLHPLEQMHEIRQKVVPGQAQGGGSGAGPGYRWD